MKLDMKISPLLCKFEQGLHALHKWQNTCKPMQHMNIRKKTQIGFYIHHTMHNCQYTSFLGFAKHKKKKPFYHDNHLDQQHKNKET
jgi:hypothetical protein